LESGSVALAYFELLLYPPGTDAFFEIDGAPDADRCARSRELGPICDAKQMRGILLSASRRNPTVSVHPDSPSVQIPLLCTNGDPTADLYTHHL